MLISVSIALFIIILSAYASAENLNLKLTGEINAYSSDVYIKTNSNAASTFEAYDMPAPSSPNNLSQFYSSADSQQLAIDSWNFSNSRTLNMVYTLPEAQTGSINFSWQAITGNYTANLVYYGENSSYSNALATINMRTNSSYSAGITSNTTLYLQVSVSNFTETATPSCGDGSCNGVETCSSCPGDCGACPAATSISGGGGGGSAVTPESAPMSLEIDVSDLIIDLVSGSAKERTITITNKAAKEAKIDLRQENLPGIVFFEETLFTLKPGESKDIKVVFNAGNQTGIFSGKIIIGGNPVYVSVNMKSKELLFDANIVVPAINKILSINENLNSQITLIPMGENPREDVTLSYAIKDFNGKTYLQESETMLVDKQISFKKEFHTTNLPPGKYVLGLELAYSGGVATSSSHFEVSESKKKRNIYTYIMIAAVIVAIMIVMVVILVIRTRTTIKSIKKLKKSGLKK